MTTVTIVIQNCSKLDNDDLSGRFKIPAALVNKNVRMALIELEGQEADVRLASSIGDEQAPEGTVSRDALQDVQVKLVDALDILTGEIGVGQASPVFDTAEEGIAYLKQQRSEAGALTDMAESPPDGVEIPPGGPLSATESDERPPEAPSVPAYDNEAESETPTLLDGESDQEPAPDTTLYLCDYERKPSSEACKTCNHCWAHSNEVCDAAPIPGNCPINEKDQKCRIVPGEGESSK
jgi:hypothetical protein